MVHVLEVVAGILFGFGVGVWIHYRYGKTVARIEQIFSDVKGG